MNNGILTEDWQGKKNAELTQTERHKMGVALQGAEAILEAIGFFKEDNHYANFRRYILSPAIEQTEKRINQNLQRLHEDATGVIQKQILRDQGMSAAFKKFADLDALETIYKVEANNLRERLRKINAS